MNNDYKEGWQSLLLFLAFLGANLSDNSRWNTY